MIQYYNTITEYLAATRSVSESSVSFVKEANTVKFDGSNIVVGLRSARTYDNVVLDKNNALVIIPRSTYNDANLPSGYTKVGVVWIGIDHPDYRGKVGLLYGDTAQTTRAWSYIYSFRLTGYTLDGTDRSGVLSIRTASNWGVAEDFTVNYNASTLSDFIAQLNAFFKDTTNPVFQTQDWVAVENDGAVDLVFHITDYRQASNTAKSGFALTANLLLDIPASTVMYRLNGQRSGEGTIWNTPRSLTYFRQDLAAGTYNPTAVQTAAQAKRSYPICLPGYLGTSANVDGDKCAAIRAIYGEGEEGWRKFMESFKPVWPAFYGPMGEREKYGDGKTNTYKMAGKVFVGQDGAERAAYPAADFCANIGFNHQLLKKGCWFLPDAEQLSIIMRDINYPTTNDRNADGLNSALYAMGFAPVSNGAGAWSSSRSFAYLAWIFYGLGGFAYGIGLSYAYRVLPLVLLDVAESNV